jgi:hypothetical protein
MIDPGNPKMQTSNQLKKVIGRIFFYKNVKEYSQLS